MKKPTIEQVLRDRNMYVKTAESLSAGLRKIHLRLEHRKDSPDWLLFGIGDMITRADRLVGPMEDYRDEVSTEATDGY